MAIQPLKMLFIVKKLRFNNCLLLVIASAIFLACNNTENEAYLRTIAAERLQEQALFIDPINSPLDSSERIHFTRLNYFPIDEIYSVNAILQKLPKTETFDLPHSNAVKKPYRKYGVVQFELKGQQFELLVLEPVKHKLGHENSLLLCFTDETSGKTTYYNGRYLDLTKPASNQIKLDFNKAYNPYCAYSNRYHCPIPPAMNKLNIAVEAGMKFEIH